MWSLCSYIDSSVTVIHCLPGFKVITARKRRWTPLIHVFISAILKGVEVCVCLCLCVPLRERSASLKGSCRCRIITVTELGYIDVATRVNIPV